MADSGFLEPGPNVTTKVEWDQTGTGDNTLLWDALKQRSSDNRGSHRRYRPLSATTKP